MKVRAVEPDIDTVALLTGAQFSDAFSVTVDGTRSMRAGRRRECWGARRDGLKH